YLFVSMDGTTLEYAASDGSTRQFSGFIVDLILSRDSVPLESLRRFEREGGDQRPIVIARSDKTGLETQVAPTPTLEYSFDDLPAGTYSFAVQAGGVVFMIPQSVEARPRGCAAVSLTNTNLLPSPVAHCSSSKDRSPLCNQFPGAQVIFKAEHVSAASAS